MDKITALIQQGKIAFEEKNYELAYSTLSSVLGGEDDAVEVLDTQELALLYSLRGTSLLYIDEPAHLSDPGIFNQVLDDYIQAIEMDPGRDMFYLLRGRLYLNCEFTDYLDEAYEDLSKALQYEEDRPDALALMGQLFYKQLEFDKAVYYFDLAAQTEPGAGIYELKGLAQFRNFPPDYAAAALSFELATGYDPNKEELYIWQAQCLQELEQYEEAIKVYDALIQRYPNRAGYYVDRGFLKAQVDPALSIGDYDLSLSLELNAPAYNNRADAYRKLDRYDEAIADANSALKLDPAYTIAYATLAEIYADKKDAPSMYRYLERALQYYYQNTEEVTGEAVFQPYLEDAPFRELLGRFGSKF